MPIHYYHDYSTLCARFCYSSGELLRESPGGRHPHYLGLRNFRMNWSVCPRIVWSNTLAVRGSAGLARIELSEPNLNPAASTSRRTVEDAMRFKGSVTFAGAPRATETARITHPPPATG